MRWEEELLLVPNELVALQAFAYAYCSPGGKHQMDGMNGRQAATHLLTHLSCAQSTLIAMIFPGFVPCSDVILYPAPFADPDLFIMFNTRTEVQMQAIELEDAAGGLNLADLQRAVQRVEEEVTRKGRES